MNETCAFADGRALRATLTAMRPRRLPERESGSCGVVMAAGTLRQLVNAWLCVRRLRAVGCTLPVEVFSLESERLPADIHAAFGADVYFRKLDLPVGVGWFIKAHALWASRFERCLWLDSDVLLLTDPSALLAGEHATFWPDAFCTSDRRFLEGFDPSLADDLELESGVFVIDTKACSHALDLARSFSAALRERVEPYVFGDKDTWRLAFAAAGTPMRTTPRLPVIVGERVLAARLGPIELLARHRFGALRDQGLVQHLPDGRPLLLHRTVREAMLFDRSQSICWTQTLSAQLGVPRVDYIAPSPLPPGEELLEVERWAAQALPEISWFARALGLGVATRLGLRSLPYLERVAAGLLSLGV